MVLRHYGGVAQAKHPDDVAVPRQLQFRFAHSTTTGAPAERKVDHGAGNIRSMGFGLGLESDSLLLQTGGFKKGGFKSYCYRRAKLFDKLPFSKQNDGYSYDLDFPAKRNSDLRFQTRSS